MSEIATAWNFMNRDRTTHQADVIGHYCGSRVCRSIVSQHSIGHYEQLWAGTYRAKPDYFDGYMWYTDLIGDFESEAAAIAAFEKLRDEIHAMDVQLPQKGD